MLNQFKTKVLVVSGGARGIGKAIVEFFAQNNYMVYYSYKNNKTIESHNIIPIKADFSKAEEIKYFFSVVQENTHKIDCLVNNVGTARFGLLATQSENDFDFLFNTNCKSLFLSYQHSVPLLNYGSSIINVSSISSIKPQRGDGIYAATKSLINVISKFMETESANKGISVHNILPGFVLTEKLQEKQYEGLREKNLSQIPLKKFSNPMDIGKIVYFLSELKHCNIQIPVTGGQHII